MRRRVDSTSAAMSHEGRWLLVSEVRARSRELACCRTLVLAITIRDDGGRRDECEAFLLASLAHAK